jgi:hypothetical protein
MWIAGIQSQETILILYSLNRMSKYFFYNIYGDSEELLASKPDDVIAVPYGLNEEAEYARHLLIARTGIIITYIPSIFTEVTDEDGKTLWKEFRFNNEMKPWSWDQVNNVVEVIPAVAEVPAVAELPAVEAVEAVADIPEISPDVVDAEATA